jgi:hypothetical protein
MGVVVHGPKVIDSGFALKVLNRLRSLGEVTTVLEGTMGRLTTIIDPGLRLFRQLRCFVEDSGAAQGLKLFTDARQSDVTQVGAGRFQL